ncbi:MAG TPA: hypothetical protein VNK49_06835 [Anaerolineales bacterium]|nr:hypothetical protein [Anaerolineales bacterium]
MLVILIVFGMSFLSACARGSTTLSEAESAAQTATVEAGFSAIPEDVPIHESAVNLKLAANNTYISYEALGTVEEITNYYRENLEAIGWEKRNKSNESPVGGVVTLLRSKEDANISVTIQSIPESDYVRVLISILRK